MRKVFLLVVLMVGVSAAFSQGLTIGVKAGINIAKETFKGSGSSGNETTDAKVDLLFGGYLTYMITEKFGVQPELLYSVQGGKQTVSGTTFKDNLTYINIPVLFRYQPIPVLNLHTGPQLGFNVAANVSSGGNSVSIKDQVKPTDFGWAFGAGVDLPMGFNITGRYITGLANINKDTSSGKDKNNVFQLTVGYKIFGK